MLRVFRTYDVRTLVVAPLLLPLLMFAFFSTSTMPAFSSQDAEIIICTGDGFETLVSQSDDDTQPPSAHEICEWASYFHPAQMPDQTLHGDYLAAQTSVAYLTLETYRLCRGQPSAKLARAPPLPL